MRSEYLQLALNMDVELLRYGSELAYMYALPHLPRPPIVFLRTGEVGINDIDFHSLWQIWILYRQVVDTVTRGEAIHVCPVRHPETSALFPTSEKLPTGRICVNAIEEGTCGVWASGDYYKGPQCAWTSLINQLLPGDTMVTGCMSPLVWWGLGRSTFG